MTIVCTGTPRGDARVDAVEQWVKDGPGRGKAREIEREK
jgi:hypothetical protein